MPRSSKKPKYSSEDSESESTKESVSAGLSDASKLRLKKSITKWMDIDDEIKEEMLKIKKLKDAKKQHEKNVLDIFDKLRIAEDEKFDIVDDTNNLRGRVYKYKSVTRGAINEDIMKKALMQVVGQENKVDQYIKKIESFRPIVERYYLKRTKGTA